MFKEETIKDGKSCRVACISWNAVISGALVAVGLSFLLNIFGLSIGLTAYTNSPEGQKILAVGGYIGMAFGVMVVMFVSGWVAGYLGRYKFFEVKECYNVKLAVLHGFSAWCVALLLSIFITAHVGQFISGQEQTLSHNEAISRLINDNSGYTSAEKASLNASGIGSQDLNENKREVKDVGKSLFLTFILFFVGAVMSAYGAFRGMESQKECKISKPI